MGIPVKGSRPLDFQGSRYRYILRSGKLRYSTGRPKLVSSCRVVTIQRVGDAGKPVGQVLQAYLASKLWYEVKPDGDFEDEATLTPMDVRQIIGVSRILGWDPAGKGTFTVNKGIDLPEWES